MIFVTVGTHTAGFDRLVRAVDEWAGRNDEEVVAQIGSSTHKPGNCRWFRFASPDVVSALMAEARVVVTHGGAGSLLAAIAAGPAVIAVPRGSAYGEAIDDHQAELCLALEREGLVRTLLDPGDLGRAVATTTRRAAPPERGDLVEAVRGVLDRWLVGAP